MWRSNLAKMPGVQNAFPIISDASTTSYLDGKALHLWHQRTDWDRMPSYPRGPHSEARGVPVCKEHRFPPDAHFCAKLRVANLGVKCDLVFKYKQI